MKQCLWLVLLVLVGGGVPLERAAAQVGVIPPRNEILTDEQLLQKLGLPTTSEGLLKYFRERTFPESNPNRMSQLIRQLADARFPVREHAFEQIRKFGSGALFSLKAASEVSDSEARQRVQSLLETLESQADPQVQAAAARLIGERKPAQACQVLLDYLPFAANDSVAETIGQTLGKLAVRDGKADPALLQALQDQKFAVKRRLAAEALVRAGGLEQVPQVRPLLKDRDAQVRLDLAVALTKLKNDAVRKEAITIVIDTLDDLPRDHLWKAENLLVRLAGKDRPNVSLGNTVAARQQYQQAWKDWWRKGKVDLSRLDKMQERLGYPLILYQDPTRLVNGRGNRGGRVIMELNGNKAESWKFTIPNPFPVDAEVIGKDRVLVVEFNSRSLSEYTFAGAVTWRHILPGNPISIQYLENGHYFVAMRNQLLELDDRRQVVFEYSRPGHDIFRARKLLNGQVVFLTPQEVNFVDPTTKAITSKFAIGNVGTYYGGIDILPNGNLLIPLFTANRVAEYTPAGQAVWQAQAQWPTSAVRLPNGNTLIGSINTRRVVELNPQGREVWSRDFAGQVYQVRVR